MLTRTGADHGRGVSLAPFGKTHGRRDGGADQTSVVTELVGGLRVSVGVVRIDAQGRLLALHSASGYRERAAALALNVGGQKHKGLSLSVSPRSGDAAASGEPLSEEQVWRKYLPEAPATPAPWTFRASTACSPRGAGC